MRPVGTSALLFPVVLHLASCAGSTGERVSSELRGEALTLAFAWPRDLTAEVEVKRLRVREDGRPDPRHVIEARYRLRTEPRTGSLRIVSEDLRVTSVDDRALSGVCLDGVERAEATVTSLAPTLRVDVEGRVLEVEGLEELRRQTAQQITTASPEAAAQAERIAEMTITSENLSEHWAAAVESWVGMELELGATYEMEVDESRPGTLEVSERVACFPGDADTGCIRLRLESWLDADAGAAQFQPAVRELVAQLGAPELPADLVVSVDLREELELLTEPERLVPHFVRARRETRIDAEHAGERRSVSRVDETEHRYRY